MSELKKRDVQVIDVEIAKKLTGTNARTSVILSLQLNKRSRHSDLLTVLSEIDGVCSVEEL
jgi:hypothetical protein